jgi:hypothetical protein
MNFLIIIYKNVNEQMWIRRMLVVEVAKDVLAINCITFNP